MIPDFVRTGYRRELLRASEQPERLVVARLGAAHAPVQAADGLDVVVEDLGAGGEDGVERFLLDAEEVGCQHLDARLRQLHLDRADRRREVARTAVGNVVAVDRGDDDVLQLHLGRRLADPQRLERVGRVLRLAGVDVAVAAGTCARLAEDLERRGAAAPALRDVRAASLLADGVEREPVQQLLDVVEVPVGARRADLHPLRPAWALGDGKRRLHRSEPSCGLRGRAPPAPRARARTPLRAPRPQARAPRRRSPAGRARARSS